MTRLTPSKPRFARINGITEGFRNFENHRLASLLNAATLPYTITILTSKPLSPQSLVWLLKMADREGFEPSVTLLPHTLSKRAHSTTLTSALLVVDEDLKRVGAGLAMPFL